MQNDEKYLRKETRKAIDACRTKKACKLSERQKEEAVDAAVNFWNQGNVRGIDAMKHGVSYAKSMGGSKN